MTLMSDSSCVLMKKYTDPVNADPTIICANKFSQATHHDITA